MDHITIGKNQQTLGQYLLSFLLWSTINKNNKFGKINTLIWHYFCIKTISLQIKRACNFRLWPTLHCQSFLISQCTPCITLNNGPRLSLGLWLFMQRNSQMPFLIWQNMQRWWERWQHLKTVMHCLCMIRGWEWIGRPGAYHGKTSMLNFISWQPGQGIVTFQAPLSPEIIHFSIVDATVLFEVPFVLPT